MNKLVTTLKNQSIILDKFYLYCVVVCTAGFALHLGIMGNSSLLKFGAKMALTLGLNMAIFFIIFYGIFKIPPRFSKFKNLCKYALAGLSAMILIIELFLIFSFSSLIRQDFIEVALQTNMAESSEFLGFYMTKNLALIYGIFILLSAIYFKAFNFRLKIDRNFGVIATLVLCFGYFLASMGYSIKRDEVCFALNTTSFGRLSCATTLALKDTKAYLEQYAKLNNELDSFIKEQLANRGGAAVYS
ncbi:hypothetical protein [Helicobacter sp. 16-1353]|uniref:hypothetical protein n=1 Tax=Helicobacter sp. 16-1353 TaxID=2004996 RepID=UPI0011BD6CB2|nr:hypothetical protein [Helicobacter sp. 16-1353]